MTAPLKIKKKKKQEKKGTCIPKGKVWGEIQIAHFMLLPKTAYGFNRQLGNVLFSVLALHPGDRGSGSNNLGHSSGSTPSS